MRLHLVVQRHGLPVTRVLWTTSAAGPTSRATSANSSFATVSSSTLTSTRAPNASVGLGSPVAAAGSGGYTIAQLLEDINEVIPLETDVDEAHQVGHGQWGLEDYAVEVASSECLHFMEVDGLLRDGDEVLIRALQLSDLVARRLAGRHQITADGKHLIDGVPFGKTYIKRSVMSRPPITIPPRKKRRLNFGGWDIDSRLPEDEDDEEIDPDWQEKEEEHGASGGELVRAESNEKQPSIAEGPRFTRSQRQTDLIERAEALLQSQSKDALPKRRKSVSFEPRPLAPSEHTSSDVSLEDSVSTTSVETDESDDSDITSVVSSNSSSTSDDSSSISSSESEDEDESACSKLSRQRTPLKKVVSPSQQHFAQPPGKGTSRTRNSNRRNKLRRRLLKMKEAGVLHQNANFDDLRAWDAAHAEGKSQQKHEKHKTPTKADKEESEFEKRREKLLRDLENGGVDVSPPKKAIKTEIASQLAATTPKSVAILAPEVRTTSEPSQRQAKLDVASSRRLLFGSLGLRTPKTKDDEAKLRQKLKPTTTQRKPIEKHVTNGDLHGSLEDKTEIDSVENWEDKLILQATECVFEDVELTNPPFPFVQRWDSTAQTLIRQRKHIPQTSGRKRKRKSQAHQYQYDVPFEENYDNSYYDHSLLDYDEPVNGEATVEVNGVSLDGANTVQHADSEDSADTIKGLKVIPSSLEDDLPALPDDVNTLSVAKEGNVRPGMILAFKQLDMSKETNWQPTVSQYRVANVEQAKNNGELTIRLAKRDRRQGTTREEDESGVRIYSKFEMPGFDEDEDEDDGMRETTFGELIEPKILCGVATEKSADVVKETMDIGLPPVLPDSLVGDEGTTEPPVISSPTRKEISQMIRDAGFRPTIDSDFVPIEENNFSLQQASVDNGGNQDEVSNSGEAAASPVGSPKFNGFASSPPPVIPSSVVVPEDVGEDTHLPDSLDNSKEEDDNFCSKSHSVPQTGSKSLGPVKEKEDLEKPSAMSSDDGLQYINQTSEMDNAANITGEVSQETKSPTSFQVPQPEASELGTLYLTIPASVEHNQPSNNDPESHSSIVTNPFYYIDRINETRDLGLEPLRPAEPVASTAPARTEAMFPPVTKTRQAFSAPRQGSPSPAPSENSLPSISEMMEKAESSYQPTTSQAPEESQPPGGSQFVDLTQISSDPQSPGNSDGDFAASQGLPRGKGWVQKRRGRRRTRNKSPGEESISSPPKRRRTLRTKRSIV